MPGPAVAGDNLGSAVDPQRPRRPRANRGEVVDDQRHLVIPGCHVAVFASGFHRQAGDVEIGSIELVSNRHHVWLPVA